jgi:Tfp pilus assembly major pilin PilA
MIEREVRVSSDETVAEQEEEKVSEEKTGEEQGGVVGEDGNVVATAYGNTATTTTVAARNWNEVDLIDWDETDSQQQQAVQPQPHGAGLVETSSSHHPEEEKNAGDVATPSQQEWNLMDLDLFKGDASVVFPARTAAGGVSAISSNTSVPPAAEAPEITRTKSLGHMESSTDMGCAAATTVQQVTDTTGKKEEEEGASSIQQRPLWRRRADNPTYSRSKSATHVLVRASVLVHILQPTQTAARAFA